MTEWLAVVVFCLGQECRFWSSTDKPFYKQSECQAIALEVERIFLENGAASTLSTCIPIRWVKV